MKLNGQKSTHYSAVLVFFIVLGLLAGLFLTKERIKVETPLHSVENIVNYDAAMRAASFEKKPTAETVKSFKDAGITAMAIYDRTLKKLSEAGEIYIVSDAEEQSLVFYDGVNRQLTPGDTYILPVNGKYDYFKETWEALNHRLGPDKVKVRQTNRGIALELSQPKEALLDMNLAISRLQAMEVSNLGFNVIVRPTNFKNETKSDVDFTLNRLAGIPAITGIVFVGKDVLGYPNDLGYVAKRLNDMRIPIVGIEATDQLQYEEQAGFLDLAATERYQVGRLYTISDDYLKKLKPHEVTQQFYITDLERNVRYNLLPIFEKGVGNETALSTSLGYITELKEKLEDRGFTFGRASIYPSYSPNPLYLNLVFIGSIALFVFTLSLLVKISDYKQLVLLFSLTFLTIVGYFITSGEGFRQLWALSAAICAPVAAITLCMDCWKSRMNSLGERRSFLRSLGEAVLYTVVAALIALVGGIFVGTILGSTSYFMEFSIFRGVKLTFVMPVILCAIAYFERFPLWKGRTISSLDDFYAFLKEFLTLEVKMYYMILAGALALGAWIFVGRSGNTSTVPVPSFEIALRRFLENTLYARPREKEFLIGYPALMLAVYAFLRRWPMIIHFVLTVVAVIGVGSMVETFAHIRTPIYMSIIRGWNGLWAGLLVGIIVICLFRIMQAISDWYGKREDTNE